MGIFGKIKELTESVQKQNSSTEKYSYGKFAVVDVETTGLNPETHRVIELCILTVSDGEVTEAWTSRFNPEGPVGKTEIHGITDKDVRDAPLFKENVSEILARLENILVVAHNARFDLAFLRAEFERAGIKSPWLPSICTLNASTYYQPHLDRRRLSDCCDDIGIEISNAHSAMGDSIATAQLFHYFLNPHKDPTPRMDDLGLIKNPNAKLGTTNYAPKNPHIRNRIEKAKEERLKSLPNSSYTALVKLLSACSISEVVEAKTFPGYEEYLEKVIELLSDGVISEEESRDLQAIADIYELDSDQIVHAHEALMVALISQALNDESISVAERNELNVAAGNLSVDKSRLTELIKKSKELRAKSLSRNLVTLPESWKLGEPLRVGQKVVFTGCDPEWRSEFEKEAKKVGVAISSSVSKKTSFLITDGSYVGNKANDAAALGVRVISPDEFELLLKYLQPAVTQ